MLADNRNIHQNNVEKFRDMSGGMKVIHDKIEKLDKMEKEKTLAMNWHSSQSGGFMGTDEA